MLDGPARRSVKWIARMVWGAELSLRRGLRPRPRWKLRGTCEGCGRCCERPTIAIGRLAWYLPLTQALFVAWQRIVNGFTLVERVRAGWVLVFRCTHYDPETRLCDSYGSRPGMCRDYPRVVLDQSWPELFADCTHRLLDGEGEGLAEALDASSLDEAARARLKDRLRL